MVRWSAAVRPVGMVDAKMAGMDYEHSRNPALLELDAVLFDLDGTVVNTIPHILASFRHATTEVFGEAPPDHVLLKYIGIPLAQQFRTMTEDERVVEDLLAAYRRFNRATHDDMALVYPNSRGTLAALKEAGVPVGIVTSKSRTMAERALELFDLSDYVSVLVTLEDTPNHKPDPMPVLLGAELIGVEPSRCAYVGDAVTDIVAGKAAGTATIGAAWGVTSREHLAEVAPDAIIDDIGELPALLGIGAAIIS